MSNYPPGVSGNEWQINGPIREDTVRRVCARCSFVKEYNGWMHTLPSGRVAWYVLSEDGGSVLVDDCDVDDYTLPVFTNHAAAYWGNACVTYVCEECDYDTEVYYGDG